MTRESIDSDPAALVVGFASKGGADTACRLRSMDEFDSRFGEPSNGAESYARHEVEEALRKRGEVVFYRVGYPGES